MITDQVQCGAGIESGQQHERSTLADTAIQLDSLGERVKQRQRHQLRLTEHVEKAVTRQRVQDKVSVCELGALGLTCGAAGVQDDRSISRVGRDQHILARVLAEEFGQVVDGNGEFACGDVVEAAPRIVGQVGISKKVSTRARIAKMVGDFSALQHGVHRYDDRARLQDPVIDDGELENIRDTHRDSITGVDATANQQRCDLIGRSVDLTVGHPAVPFEHCCRSGSFPGGISQHDREIEHELLSLSYDVMASTLPLGYDQSHR